MSAPTLQLGVHGDVGEAAQHGHDLIVLLLPQGAQHVSPVRVLVAHQVLQCSDFILRKDEEEEGEHTQLTQFALWLPPTPPLRASASEVTFLELQ